MKYFGEVCFGRDESCPIICDSHCSHSLTPSTAACISPKACRIANDEMAKVIARYPDRFIGVALIPTTTEKVAASLFSSHFLFSFALGFESTNCDTHYDILYWYMLV